MKKPTRKLKREMERLLVRLEEQRKTSTGAMAAEAAYFIAVNKAYFSGEKVNIPIPETLFEDYSVKGER